jgi:carbon monoxide dehydrogenase subunit G
MELIDALRIPLAPPTVRDALADTALVRASLENCEAFTRLPSGEFALTLIVPLGPLRARYDVRAHLADYGAAPGEGGALRRVLNFKACAAGVGSLRGQVDIQLSADAAPLDAGQAAETADVPTRIDYTIWATLTGPLAELPPRQIENALHELVDDFFVEFSAVLEAKHGRRPNRARLRDGARQHVFLRPISLAGMSRRAAAQAGVEGAAGRAGGSIADTGRSMRGLDARPASQQAMPTWAWVAAVVFVAVLLYASHWLG